MCLSLEPSDVERLEKLCHFTLRLVPVITWFTLPSHFSSFITQSLILTVTLFLSTNIFVVAHSQELCYTLYIVKAKENSR
jgi:hypothetical protein